VLVIEQFRQAIHSAGLHPPDAIEPDGLLHRFASSGKRGDDAGWYVLHDDTVPAGAFGDWRGGLSQTWRADIGRSLSPQEEAAHRVRIESMRREREAEEVKRRAEARENAALIWAEAPPCANHGYLARKGIEAHGARLSRGRLVLPIRDESGVLHSLQFIDADGGKKYLTAGRIRGCYFGIGKPDGVLCIAEGFATAASIHESTGHAVAIAFDCGNLLPVAKSLREKLPDVKIVVCGDNDTKEIA
jgi:putative DNA primase/helicase